MSVVQEFDRLITAAKSAGYKVRYDYFGGTGGGVCQFGGATWIFIDLALSVTERLEYLQSQLADDPLVNVETAEVRRAA